MSSYINQVNYWEQSGRDHEINFEAGKHLSDTRSYDFFSGKSTFPLVHYVFTLIDLHALGESECSRALRRFTLLRLDINIFAIRVYQIIRLPQIALYNFAGIILKPSVRAIREVSDFRTNIWSLAHCCKRSVKFYDNVNLFLRLLG